MAAAETTTAQPLPSAAELLDRAITLQPVLREYAERAETERRMSDELGAALDEAGLFRMFVPRRFGGYECELRTVLEVTEALAVADGSASWLVAVGAVAAWIAGWIPPSGRRELFALDRNVHVAGSSSPTPAKRVAGGLRLSGRWAWASGAHQAEWGSLAAVVPDDDGAVLDVVFCLVPVAELTVEDTWRSVGMRGTGSHTWTATDLFVPEHRIVSMQALTEDTVTPAPEESMYRLPLAPVATLALLGPVLGLGRAAFDLVRAQAGTKAMRHTFFARQADSVGVQIQLAEAALKLKTARLHVYGIADELDAKAAAGETVDFPARAEIRAELGYAAHTVLDSINILLNVHGAGAFAEPNVLQRHWRDANTAARHAGLNAYVGYEAYGKALLDVPDRITPMI